MLVAFAKLSSSESGSRRSCPVDRLTALTDEQAAEHRLSAALDAPQPTDAAHRLAEALKAAGWTQLATYRLYCASLRRFEDGDPRYDALLDTLDCIVGYCSPHARIFDGYLTNHQVADGRGSERRRER